LQGKGNKGGRAQKLITRVEVKGSILVGAGNGGLGGSGCVKSSMAGKARAVHCQGARGKGKGGLGGTREGWGEPVEKGRPRGSQVAGQGRGWEVRESVEFPKWVLGSSHNQKRKGVAIRCSWRAYWES